MDGEALWKSSDESDESLDGSYFQVNPQAGSPNSEAVKILATDGDLTTSNDDTIHGSLDQVASELSSLVEHRPLRRDDSISSTGSSILVAPEDSDFTPIDKNRAKELRQSLSNLNSECQNLGQFDFE